MSLVYPFKTESSPTFEGLLLLSKTLTEASFSIFNLVDEGKLEVFSTSILSHNLHQLNHSILEKISEEKKTIINLDPAQELLPGELVPFPQIIAMPLLDTDSNFKGNLLLIEPQLNDLAEFRDNYFQKLSLINQQLLFAHKQNKRLTDLKLKLEKKKKNENILKRKVRSNNKIFKKKSRLLAHVSHEIRTPMQGIIGLTEKLRNTRLDKEQKIILENLSKSESTLMNLVNDVLDFSKLNNSSFNLQFKPGYIHEVIEEVKSLYAPIAKDKGNIIYTDNKDFPPVLVDVLRLKQILSNLVNNALKFTENGTIHIRAIRKESNNQESWYRFEIEDTGIGISNDFKERIYQEYSQNEEWENNGGTGLGLAISKMIIDKFGGKFGFISPVYPEKIDQPGSLFWFSIPLESTTEKPNHVKKEIFHNLQGKKVLFIDDDQFVQMVCKNMLNQEGLIPHVVSSGQEAMSLMEKESFDLILSDLNLPEMNGLDIAQKIKSDFNYQGPLVCVSAYQDENSISKAKAAGFNHFISKPFNQRTLKKLLSKISE